MELARVGPCSDRLSAMKAAFRSQYNTQFRASSDHTWERTTTSDSVVMPPPPSAAEDEIQPSSQSPSTSIASSQSHRRIRDPDQSSDHMNQSGKRTKKSRWE
ncbi:hypothetical protein QAD02_007590 [Eretmocerus hayati]|uniref:Uncharacterized protein n=1 Tax=Eretmocerus hayati TaxID=131215 RepID=A0ACC2N5B5_9HYME|nr:hypothetical protein QAD02_007590 [Eretmocerus hayati]